MSSSHSTPSPAFPAAPALQYLLNILTERVDRLEDVHSSTYTEFLSAEQIQFIQTLPGSITVLQEVARYGPYRWIGSVVDVLKSAEQSLRGKVRELEGALGVAEASEVEKGKLKRRDSGEWVVVDDDFVNHEKEEAHSESEEDKAARLQVVSDRHASLAALCDTLGVIIPLIPVPTSELGTSFQAPVTVEDFQGNKFLFPSEFSVADLEAIIKVRSATGKASQYIERGQFELLLARDWSRPLAKDDKLKPNDWIHVVAIVSSGKVGFDQCPKPTCKGRNDSDKGILMESCPDCGVMFYRAQESVTTVTSTATTRDTENLLPSLPYKFSDEAPANEDFSSFQFIKIYPLKTLITADVADDKIYQCKTEGCGTHLARQFDIVSKNFRGNYGQAYLFCSLDNISRGPSAHRNMTTGKHTICDVYCRKCGEGIGWLYEKAEMPSEQYKVGKFLVEMEKVEMVRDEEKEEKQERGEETVRGWNEKHHDLLSRVRMVQGELGLEDLEQRLKALMDEENGINRDRRDEEDD